MESFTIPIQIRWADLDPNLHLRHSVYYDWGALSRINFLQKIGVTTHLMAQFHMGPILFREECVFKREIGMDDRVTIDLQLLKSRRNFTRWSIQHIITKNEDTVSAIITVDLSWIDTVARKLLIELPKEISSNFESTPKSNNFQWVE